MRILFQRNEDSTQDDAIRVETAGSGRVTVQYTYRKGATTEKEMSCDEFLSYLNGMFQLINADVQPFTLVQFDLPLMPSICLKPTQLSWMTLHIIEQVRIQLAANQEPPVEREPQPPSLFEQFVNSTGNVQPH